MGLFVGGDLSGTISNAIINKDTNVLTYGADPTGIADSASAIIAAIAALSSEGGTVLIPRGTYLIGAEIVLGDNICLEASSGAVFKKNTTDINVIRITGVFSSVKGLELDGNSQAQGSLILVTGGKNTVSDCYLHNNGLMADALEAHQSHGITLDGQSSTCTGNIIVNNRISTVNGIGISQNTAPDNQILNNDISTTGLEGITVDVNSHRFRVIGNRILGARVNTGVGAIGMDGSELGILTNNIILGTNNSLAGIKTQNNTGSCNYNTISNNIILDNGGWGIWLFTGTSGSSSWCCLIGNIVRGNLSGSIRLESGCDNNQVRGNSLNGVAASNAGSNNTIN